MLLLRTLSRSRSLHPLSRSLSVARSHTQAFTLIADTETQSHLSTEHATETQTHLSTRHRTPRQQSARASERRQACDMDGLQCSRLKVATATKVVVAGERPDPGASSHHRIIGTMQAHLRWMLAVRAAQIHEAFCVFASATAVPHSKGPGHKQLKEIQRPPEVASKTHSPVRKEARWTISLEQIDCQKSFDR